MRVFGLSCIALKHQTKQSAHEVYTLERYTAGGEQTIVIHASCQFAGDNSGGGTDESRAKQKHSSTFSRCIKWRHAASWGVAMDSFVAPSRKVGRNGLWAGHYCSVVVPAGKRASAEQRLHKNDNHDKLQKARGRPKHAPSHNVCLAARVVLFNITM